MVRWSGWLPGLVILFLLGCGDGGPKLYPATGTITMDSKPVDGAEVVFASEAGLLATGTTDANGKFSLQSAGKPGAPEGTYRVTVTKSISSGPPTTTMTPEDMAKMATENKMPKVESLLPAKYSVVQSTDLNATVTKDKSKNDFPFVLTP